MEIKRPSFQFYPGDWLRDTALRSCSVGARGLWVDMLAWMHDGQPYGHLKVNHKVILPVNLARMVGATLPEVEGWIAELEDANVFSRSSDGAIYSRRMVRDEELRLKRAAGGSLGGNPALKHGEKVNPKVGNKVNLPPNLQPTPSSSSSSSSSSALEDTPLPPEGEVCVVSPDEFKNAWNALGAPFPKIVKLDGNRLKTLRARCADKFWLEHWRSALATVPSSPFLRGEGERGWIANVDWFLRPDSVLTIIEGKYKPADRNGTAAHQPPTASPEDIAKRVEWQRDNLNRFAGAS